MGLQAQAPVKWQLRVSAGGWTGFRKSPVKGAVNFDLSAIDAVSLRLGVWRSATVSRSA